MPSSGDTDPGRAATGIEGLDDILRGGFPRNRIHLIEGDPGAGKTTLALQFLLRGVRDGERGLYVTLSETPDELDVVAQSHGWNLDGIDVCDLAASEGSLRADAQYTLFHPSEVELGETTETILSEVERIQPSRVVIDSFSELRLLARDPLRYRRQILALKRYFGSRQITVLLLNDRHSEMNDAQLPSLVYGVVELSILSPSYGTERRHLQITKLRGSDYRGGYHDFILRTGGMEVYPRLIASEHHGVFRKERVSSGIPEVDSLLGGGLFRGTSTLIHGPTGSGKSTLATQFCIAAALRGERSYLYVFEEDLETLYTRSESLDMPLREWVDRDRIRICHMNPAEVSPGAFAHMVRRAVLEEETKMIVVDSLNGYTYAMPEERFLSAHLHELFTYLNRQGIVTIAIMAQHGSIGTPITHGSSFDVSYVADAVILIRYFEAIGRVRKALSIMKNRAGSHERTIREIELGPTGIDVGEPILNFQGVLTGAPEYLSLPLQTVQEVDDARSY